jgi:subtilisin family serine protease
VPTPNTVVVAVVDSGVNASQPDLAGRVTTGYNVFDGSSSTNDDFGHGTLVAGVIAARTGNGIGVAGVCGACVIMPVKALDAQGVGTSGGIAAGIDWAVDHGANIVNLSIVLSGDAPDVRGAVEYAHDRGVLVVAAAGNDGGGNATYPASYPGVLSVAATDQNGQRYSWSTYGDWVSVAAPGCTQSTAADGSYPQFCGTSAAAPLVAGLAGLAMATGRPSALAAGDALQQTATPLPGVAHAGRVDALALLQQFAH